MRAERLSPSPVRPPSLELVPLSVETARGGSPTTKSPLSSPSRPKPLRVGQKPTAAHGAHVSVSRKKRAHNGDILLQQLREAEKRVRSGEEDAILLRKDTDFFRSRVTLNHLYRTRNVMENCIAVLCVASLSLATGIAELEAAFCDGHACTTRPEPIDPTVFMGIALTPAFVAFAILICKVVILVLCVGSAAINLGRYALQQRIKVLRFMIPRKAMCASPGQIAWLLFCSAFLLFHVPPGIEFNVQLETTTKCGNSEGEPVRFWLSANVWNAVMIIRTLPPLFLVMRNICIRHSSQVSAFCLPR